MSADRNGLKGEIVDTFVDAVVRVMWLSVREEARLVATRYATDVDPPPSIKVSIQLTGGLRGPVTWSFSPTLARRVAESMMMGAPADAYHADAVAELANMVLGNAAGGLADAGFLVELHPPLVSESRRTGPKAVVVDITSSSGDMKLLFDLEETAPV